MRSWEKQLQQIFDETSVQKLLSAADTAVSKYFDSLPAPGVALPSHYAAGASPFDHLQQAMYCVATAVKLKGKDAALHFRLGMLLEEQFFLENIIGFKVDKVLCLMLSIVITSPHGGVQSIVMSLSVCLSLCVCMKTTKHTHPQTHILPYKQTQQTL